MYMMIVIILSFFGWAGTARVIRGMSLSLAKSQYVQASKAMGQSPLKIILKHFLPNVLSYLIVGATLSIPAYILGEAALSFLGLGIQEPSASWGLMLAQAQNDTRVLMLGFWWLLSPGIAIFATVLAFNMLGDILRDIADPKKEK
jgi:peptide/nickel transport system permease protein